jgi:DNA ligase (NAD+)
MAKQAKWGLQNDNRPYASIAYKFDSVAREGYVSDIVIQCGSMGRLTPVAVFNPKISLMGAEVEKASLHNFSNIEELGVGIGATVLVCRSNDVIPFLEEVISPPDQVFPRPTHCPECGTPVVEKGEYMQCPNTATCPAQVLGRLLNWIKELNILEWGESVLTKVIESGKVSTVADLYILTVDDLSSLDRMGKKSAQKCYDILHANMEVPLEVLLGGLSIPMIGQSTIKLVMAAGYDTLDLIRKCSIANFENIVGIGPTKAASLWNGLRDNEKLIDELLNNGVKIKEKIVGSLTGKSFALTGKMENKRAVLEKMITDAGGTVKGSVGKGLSFLVINEPSGSSKAVSAQKLGTALINETELLEMINQ